MPRKTLYVVAYSQKEADALASEIGHESLAAARRHLAEVQSPPTDPFYASKYKIWRVKKGGSDAE